MAYDTFHRLLIPLHRTDTPARLFLAGALSGVTAVFVTYPLEVIRVRLAFETREKSAGRIRLLDTVQSIYREPGHPNQFGATPGALRQVPQLFDRVPITKFYRGFTPTLCGQFSHEWSIQLLGLRPSGLINALTHVTCRSCLAGMVPYAGTSFLVWGTLQSKLLPNRSSQASSSYGTALNLLCGSIAGMVSQTASYPLEIIRRKMQIGGLGTSPIQSMAEVAQAIYLKDGLRGFFVGLSIGYIKVIPMTAISFVTWSSLKIRFD